MIFFVNKKWANFSLIFLLLQCCFFSTLYAKNSAPQLDQAVQKITEELRCVVCQNQTVADSHADLAQQLRQQVREQLQQGKNEQDVKQFMVDRYGDFILYRPPLRISTVLLWFGPGLIFLLALFLLGRRLQGAKRRLWLVDDEESDGIS